MIYVYFLQTFFIFVSFLFLENAFLSDDFSVLYVANNSNPLLPNYYKFSALWGGHEGSMLLWCLILSFWTFMASIYSKSLDMQFRIKFLSVMGFLNLGFLRILCFTLFNIF